MLSALPLSVHVTGTGDAQERFINYLAETPQYKNAVTKDSTSNRMSEEKLIDYVTHNSVSTVVL